MYKDRKQMAAFYGRSAAANPEAIRAQLAFARGIAQEEGDTIPEDPALLFIDDGVDGLSTPRPAWERLVDAVAGGAKPPFERVYLGDRTRISRGSPQEVLDAERLLMRYGVTLRYCTASCESDR